MTVEEKTLIEEGEEQTTVAEPPPSYASLLEYKQTWVIVLARFSVDPIWRLYIRCSDKVKK